VKGLIKNSAALFLFQVVSRGLAFLAFVYLARLLGVAEIGNFAYIISLSALLNLFVEFGTNQYLIKAVASGNSLSENNSISSVLGLKFTQFVIGIILLSVLEYDSLIRNFQIINLTIVYVLFEGIAQIGISMLNGKQEFIKANTCSFIYEVTRSILLLAVLIGTQDLAYVPIIYIGVAILYASVLFWMVLREHITRSIIWTIITNPMPSLAFFYKNTYLFFISAIAYQLYFRVDMILLKRLSSSIELGVYSTAYKFFEVFLFVPAILSGIVFPAVVAMHREGEDQWKPYLKMIQSRSALLISSLILGIIVFSDWIIVFFFGSSFSDSATIMQILFMTSFLYAFNFIYPIVYNSTGNERYMILIFTVGFTINLLLNYALLPSFGAIAAAYINFLSEFVVTLLYYFILKRKGLDLISARAFFLTLFCIVLSSHKSFW
jgi:O-antigen/teichoic acid export membrane protein